MTLHSEGPRGTRRVVYVSDPSNTTALYSDPAEPEQLRQWVRNLAKAGVDTYVQEVFCEAWSLFYRTDLCEYDTRPQHQRFIPMMDAGTMPIEIYIEEAHKLGLEFIAGFRMNDRHGQNQALVETYKDWVLEDFGYGVDYSVPEVRDWMFSIAEEIANRFDVDGLEFNFIRWGHCFPPATAAEQHPAMTELIRRVREMLDKAPQHQGRRPLLGVRVPQTLQGCHKLGYDIPTWIGERLVDYVAPCDFHYTDFNARYDEFAELTRASDCYLYPAFQPMLCKGNQVALLNLDQYRAVVQNFYGAGADGLSVHNYQYHWSQNHWASWLRNRYPGPAYMYPQALEYFNALRDPQVVAAADRHYLFYPLWPDDGPMGAYEAQRAVLKRDQPGQRAEYRFRICEHLPETVELPVDDTGRYEGTFTPSGEIPGAWLIFRAIGLVPGDNIALDINGQEIAAEDITHVWYQQGRPAWEGRTLPPYTECRLALTAPPGVWGDNYLGLTLTKSSPEAEGDIVVDEVEVIVRPTHSSAEPGS